MKKIFELTTEDFLSGVSQIDYGNRGGLFYSAVGINPFVNISLESKDFGLLQTSKAPIDLTGAVVKDIIIAFATQITGSGTGYLYGLGNSGHFYVIVLSGAFATTDEKSGTQISNTANGLVIYKGKLYYAQTTQIGQVTETTPPFDSASTWDDDWSGAASLQDYAYHPMHLFSDKVWVADKDRIDSISGATPTFNSAVLNVPSDYRILALENDGKYLIIGMTQNLGDNIMMGRTKILFWDTYSDSWNKEWTIPDSNIVCLKTIGNWIYAICGRGIYRFNYETAPQKLFPILTSSNSPDYGRCWGVDNLSDMLIWAGSQLQTYGPPLPGYPSAYFTPFAGFTGDVISISGQGRLGYIFVSTSSNKLYYIEYLEGGATSKTATTNFIPLGKKYKIEAIKIMTANVLATGDSLNIDVNNDSNSSAVDWGTVSYAAYGAIRQVTLISANPLDAEDLQLVFNFNGGNVKIRKVEVWGSVYKDTFK